MIDRIKAAPQQPGNAAIRIPGERALRSREPLWTEGIEIDRPVYDAFAPITVRKQRPRRQPD